MNKGGDYMYILSVTKKEKKLLKNNGNINFVECYEEDEKNEVVLFDSFESYCTACDTLNMYNQ